MFLWLIFMVCVFRCMWCNCSGYFYFQGWWSCVTKYWEHTYCPLRLGTGSVCYWFCNPACSFLCGLLCLSQQSLAWLYLNNQPISPGVADNQQPLPAHEWSSYEFFCYGHFANVNWNLQLSCHGCLQPSCHGFQVEP